MRYSFLVKKLCIPHDISTEQVKSQERLDGEFQRGKKNVEYNYGKVVNNKNAGEASK